MNTREGSGPQELLRWSSSQARAERLSVLIMQANSAFRILEPKRLTFSAGVSPLRAETAPVCRVWRALRQPAGVLGPEARGIPRAISTHQGPSWTSTLTHRVL